MAGASPASTWQHPPRRTVLRGLSGLAAAGAVPALAGCSALDSGAARLRELVGQEDASPRPTPTPPSDPADPDVRLAVEVVLLSEAAAAALDAWAGPSTDRPRRLAQLAAAAAETHRQHAGLVQAAVPPRADPGEGSLAPALLEALQSDRGTLRSVVRIEELAGAGLRDASLAARSGPFASLLASMVAASAQHSALLRGLGSAAGSGGGGGS